MKLHKSKKKHKNLELSNNTNVFDFKKQDNNIILDDSQNIKTLSNTLYNEDNKDNLFLNLLFNLNGNKNKCKLFNINNKNKKIFNNEIINLNIEKELNKNNNYSFDVKNTLFDKFKFLPNITKYHYLTNENLLKLIKVDTDNSFVLHRQRTKHNNYNIFNEYLKNAPRTYKNKSITKNRMMFLNYSKNKSSNKNINNIRQCTLNSNYMDINYKAHIHKSWCNLFKKNNKLNPYKNKKNKSNHKYQLTSLYTNTITSEESINNKTKENKKSRKSKESLKSKINDENSNSKINTNNNKVKKLRRSSAIDRFLFKLINKDECYEEYVSDGRPIDKYQFFKNQIEKNRKNIEKQLLELRRHQT